MNKLKDCVLIPQLPLIWLKSIMELHLVPFKDHSILFLNLQKHLKTHISCVQEGGKPHFSGFSISAMPCNDHHSLISGHSQPPKKTPCTHQQLVRTLASLIPWQPLIYFLSLWTSLFWTSHINRIIQSVIFVTGFFHSA